MKSSAVQCWAILGICYQQFMETQGDSAEAIINAAALRRQMKHGMHDLLGAPVIGVRAALVHARRLPDGELWTPSLVNDDLARLNVGWPESDHVTVEETDQATLEIQQLCTAQCEEPTLPCSPATATGSGEKHSFFPISYLDPEGRKVTIFIEQG